MILVRGILVEAPERSVRAQAAPAARVEPVAPEVTPVQVALVVKPVVVAVKVAAVGD
jgi:hypothetical protein